MNFSCILCAILRDPSRVATLVLVWVGEIRGRGFSVVGGRGAARTGRGTASRARLATGLGRLGVAGQGGS